MTQTPEARFERLIDAAVDAILDAPDEELMADPEFAKSASETRAVVELAIAKSAHDRGDWMNWKTGDALVRDGDAYEVEMVDGARQMVIAEVYGEDEFDLYGDDGVTVDGDTVSRIRKL